MKISLAEKISHRQIPHEVDENKIGKIVEMDESGQIYVDFHGNIKGPIKAQFTKSIKDQLEIHEDVSNQRVLLVFENNNPDLPIIIDTLHSTVNKTPTPASEALEIGTPQEVKIDGNQIVFDAKKEIVLRCGKASITLTKAGKILIRGAYLLNRSSGVNRIKGGSVQIN